MSTSELKKWRTLGAIEITPNQNKADQQYRELIQRICREGFIKSNRTGIDTIGLFNAHMTFDLQEGFPLLTHKKVHFKSIVHELLWIISGNTNIKYLEENGVTIWSAWANSDGDLGPTYGTQLRKWNGHVDQLRTCIDKLRTNPDDRRIIISLWNAAELDQTPLPPCHPFIFFGSELLDNGKRRLHTKFSMRSSDVVLGSPFNIASYALLHHMIAQITEHEIGTLGFDLWDSHLYTNQFEGLEKVLTNPTYTLPTLTLNPDIKEIDDFKYEDIVLENYQHSGSIKFPVAV